MSWRLIKLLTNKDVIARWFLSVVVLSKHTRQSPDHHRVNGDDESHVFIKQGVFKDKPAKKSLEPFVYFFLDVYYECPVFGEYYLF